MRLSQRIQHLIGQPCLLTIYSSHHPLQDTAFYCGMITGILQYGLEELFYIEPAQSPTSRLMRIYFRDYHVQNIETNHMNLPTIEVHF